MSRLGAPPPEENIRMAAVMLSPDDNVAIANSRIKAGEALPGGALASDDIEPGHKVALRPRANFFGFGDSEFVPWHVGATL